MQVLTVKSPAKLNLHLRILRRRPDSYHDLLTLFRKIALCDTIRIQKTRSGFILKTNKRGLETGEGNLITKAYRALQEKFPGLGGVTVYLNKKIPMGAGLGGGSSNAAYFLLGMKKLFGLKIAQKDLLKIGKTLGADVPFFLLDAPQAIAWGIGEKLEKIPRRQKLWFCLLLTDKGLNTRKVYQTLKPPRRALSLTREKGIATLLCSLFDAKKIPEAARVVRNDLELPAFKLRPSIFKAIRILREKGASLAMMSGSGPTVFAVFPTRREAVKFAKKIPAKVGLYKKLLV